MEAFVPYSRCGRLLEAVEEAGLSAEEAAEVLLEYSRLRAELKGGPSGSLSALVEEEVRRRLGREREEVERLREVEEQFNALALFFSNSREVSPESLKRMGMLLAKLGTSMETGAVRVDDRTLERVKTLLAELIAKSVREKFVPVWMFSMLERSLREARELLREVELENERLRRAVKEGGLGIPVARLYLVTGLLIEEVPVRPSGLISSLRCEHCKEAVHVGLPPKEECEEAARSGSVFRFHCPWCGALKDLSPEAVAAMVEGARPPEGREAMGLHPSR
ncbi:MAG: hypothetical protein NZ953_00270 [Thaumarchaeota archaeon]|nr:hypothetical protein [Candidatus Calditenuaceae archaeon]MCX8203346.1 hypothetical protein [Nitrososphaeria archaeon]MDW8042994.1 hypothetical protein [Nitrososphaerota archaeon]